MKKNLRDNKNYRPPATGGFRLVGPKLEQKLNKLANEYPLLNKTLTFLFLPIAFKLGFRINSDPDNFYVEVPHKRFNRNSYGTVAGAALLANLELATGAYLLMRANSRYRLVCRSVDYSFKLPSKNGIHFIFESLEEDLDVLLDGNKPFNAKVKVIAHTLGESKGLPGRRIGRGTVSFHLWPIPGLVA